MVVWMLLLAHFFPQQVTFWFLARDWEQKAHSGSQKLRSILQQIPATTKLLIQEVANEPSGMRNWKLFDSPRDHSGAIGPGKGSPDTWSSRQLPMRSLWEESEHTGQTWALLYVLLMPESILKSLLQWNTWNVKRAIFIILSAQSEVIQYTHNVLSPPSIARTSSCSPIITVPREHQPTIPPFPHPWQAPFYFLFLKVSILRSYYEWNYTICVLLWRTYFSLINVFKFHLCYSMC
jgi:hypothetical protein